MGCGFVKDRETKEPGPEILKEMQGKCFENGVILWKGERWNNVARVMPALVIAERLLDLGIDIFDEILHDP